MALDGCSLGALLFAARLAAMGSPVPATPAEDEPDSASARDPCAGISTEQSSASTSPEDETRHPRIGSYELSGEATLGVRLLDVGGSEAQFAEDQNLERGVFLRD
jgi:hypothetical protein